MHFSKMQLETGGHLKYSASYKADEKNIEIQILVEGLPLKINSQRLPRVRDTLNQSLDYS